MPIQTVIDLRLELHHNANAFVLQCFDKTAANLELEVHKIKLFIRKVEL